MDDPATKMTPLDALRSNPVLAIDLNADHLAALLVDPSGNPLGAFLTVPLDLAGLPGTTRDGRSEPRSPG